MSNKPATTSTEKEITATALGGAFATLVVILVEWAVGTPAPSGLEGALAVVFGAGTGYIRKLIRNRRKKNEAVPELSFE